MNLYFLNSRLWFLCIVIYSLPDLTMAETNQNDAVRWLQKADLAPAFATPASLPEWETKRKEVRSRVWQLLGKLPRVPSIPTSRLYPGKIAGIICSKNLSLITGRGQRCPAICSCPKRPMDPCRRCSIVIG